MRGVVLLAALALGVLCWYYIAAAILGAANGVQF